MVADVISKERINEIPAELSDESDLINMVELDFLINGAKSGSFIIIVSRTQRPIFVFIAIM